MDSNIDFIWGTHKEIGEWMRNRLQSGDNPFGRSIQVGHPYELVHDYFHNIVEGWAPTPSMPLNIVFTSEFEGSAPR